MTTARRNRGSCAPLRLCAGLAALAACSDSTASSSSTSYVAALSGAREIPAVRSTASGLAEFVRSGTALEYTVSASGFATPLAVGHIHIGGTGDIGPVIVPFVIVAQSGTVAHGSIDLSRAVTQGNITISSDSLRALFDNGNAYVNLHTAAYPGGELRGQIVRQ